MTNQARTEYRQLLAAAQPGQAEGKRHAHALAVLDAIVAWDTDAWRMLREWQVIYTARTAETARHAAALNVVRAQPAYRAMMARTRRWVLSKHGCGQTHANLHSHRRIRIGAARRQLLDGRITPAQYTALTVKATADMRWCMAEYDRQTGNVSTYKLRQWHAWVDKLTMDHLNNTKT